MTSEQKIIGVSKARMRAGLRVRPPERRRFTYAEKAPVFGLSPGD